MKIATLALPLAAALLSVPAAGQTGAVAPPPVVSVDGGRLRGEQLADRVAFRGVPFAAPPIGALRWRPPAPVARWSGVRDATRSAPACPQLDDGWNHGNAAYSSEDCLYLEIASPMLRPARGLPVFVWIHGGGNKAGGGVGTIASSMLARGIVLVSVDYRLGPLGFMAHRALTAESRFRASGNYGLMDQQAALRWVRRNIAAFGGDPARVTIGGESAGAMDVGLLQLSPLSHGLFRAAIEESGTAGLGFAPRDLPESEAIGERLAAATGHPHATAAELRALPVAALLAASRDRRVADWPEAGSLWSQATIDGHVVTAAPAASLARGGRMPLLIGTNAQEIAFYPDLAAARARLPRAFGVRAADAARFYGLDRADPPPADPVRGSVALQIGTDIVFTCPTGLVADARVSSGGGVWRYDFAYQPPAGPPLGHASELRYVFGNPGEGGIPADAPRLEAYWANFIASGDPNGAGLAPWPAYGAERRYLTLGAGEPVAGAALRAALCEGWTRP